LRGQLGLGAKLLVTGSFIVPETDPQGAETGPETERANRGSPTAEMSSTPADSCRLQGGPPSAGLRRFNRLAGTPTMTATGRRMRARGVVNSFTRLCRIGPMGIWRAGRRLVGTLQALFLDPRLCTCVTCSRAGVDFGPRRSCRR